MATPLSMLWSHSVSFDSSTFHDPIDDGSATHGDGRWWKAARTTRKMKTTQISAERRLLYRTSSVVLAVLIPHMVKGVEVTVFENISRQLV